MTVPAKKIDSQALPGHADGVLQRLRVAIGDPEYAEEPRHIRLRTALLDALARGDWSPGDKLPSEGDISDIVGLSLGTVQKVLTRLASEQVLVRRHGHGTFVTGDSSQSSRLMHFRFIGDDDTAVMPVYAEAIDRKVIRGKGPWSEFLRESTEFIRIRRRINVADEFDCVSDFYIDANRFRPLLDTPFEELHRVTIRSLLANRFNAPTFSFSQRVYAARFPMTIAALLAKNKRGDNAFGIVLEVSSNSHHRQPVSFQNIFIPANVRRLEIPSPRLLR